MKIFRHTDIAVHCGELRRSGDSVRFSYDASYLGNPTSVSLGEELPLQEGSVVPVNAQPLHEPFRDASPDAWGRRTLASVLGSQSPAGDAEAFSLAGHDRIGALTVEDTGTLADEVPPSDLRHAVMKVCQGETLSRADADLLRFRVGVGGMRPKALTCLEGVPVILKFSHPDDAIDIVRAEYVAMRLAEACGIAVAKVSLVRAGAEVALAVRRFDRVSGPTGTMRLQLASGLTMLHLDEMFAAYASYQDVYKSLCGGRDDPATAVELLKRVTLNVACGNTDDHARNISAFWNGTCYRLAPAYDICPQIRTGNVASQGMILWGRDRMSRLVGCVRSGTAMGLGREVAMEIVEGVVETVRKRYAEVAEEAGLGSVAARRMMGRQFLNPYIFEDWKARAA